MSVENPILNLGAPSSPDFILQVRPPAPPPPPRSPVNKIPKIPAGELVEMHPADVRVLAGLSELAVSHVGVVRNELNYVAWGPRTAADLLASLEQNADSTPRTQALALALDVEKSGLYTRMSLTPSTAEQLKNDVEYRQRRNTMFANPSIKTVNARKLRYYVVEFVTRLAAGR